jgi:DNA-binding NarL/FixJ family response regulator
VGKKKTMRILLVDDDERFLGALEALLETIPGAEVAGRVLDGAEAAAAAARLRPDVILIDHAMPRVDGLAATRQIRAAVPDAQIVMLSGSDIVDRSPDARAAGAIAYVLKTQTVTELPQLLAQLQVEADDRPARPAAEPS